MSDIRADTARNLAAMERARRVLQDQPDIPPDDISGAILATLRRHVEAVETWLDAARTDDAAMRSCALMEAANVAQALRIDGHELALRIEAVRQQQDPWRVPPSDAQH